MSDATTYSYLRTNSDKEFLHGIAYEVNENSEGDSLILGAYFGYIGGGEYDGGFFLIDFENSINKVISYDDASNSDYSEIFDNLMGIAGGFCEDSDSSSLSKKGRMLIKKAEKLDGDFIYMDEDFDGDMLADISEIWQLTLKFES
jgi:hypothetical protein